MYHSAYVDAIFSHYWDENWAIADTYAAYHMGGEL